ncbi:MAG: fumarylacetoacetase [Bacteroidetes bacterium]|nr:fumarylacetoacetase [Bacteroidota bacterium]
MIEANAVHLSSWIEVDQNSDFPIQNLPFGVFRKKKNIFSNHLATRIGDTVIDLYFIAKNGFFEGCGVDNIEIFNRASLNDFIGLGQPVWRSIRKKLSELFRYNNPLLRDNYLLRSEILLSIEDVEMLLPITICDLTDFNSSLEHAINIGKMYRDPANPLPPNWRHLPEGYHGRTSSIFISGTNIHRPKGQFKPGDSAFPLFGPSRRIDFELEVAFISGYESHAGIRIPIEKVEEKIFGMVLLNLLAARDFQTWEQIPLGPFLSKSFGGLMSPWIVTLDALQPFRIVGPRQEPEVLPYLQTKGAHNYDISLEAKLRVDSLDPLTLCKTNYKYVYWNICQQIAHQTINGARISIGDVFASGTICGQTPDSFGSMLELTWRGSKPIQLANGKSRKFLEDYDIITINGYAKRKDNRIGFGECITQILPTL